MRNIETLSLVFNSLPKVDTTVAQPGHLDRLGKFDRRVVRDPLLWTSLYKSLQPVLVSYYDSVNSGDPLTSSEASGYLKWSEENNIARSMQIAAELFAIQKAPSGPILVLGTGSGFDTAIPAANFPTRQFTATEISPVASSNARKLLHSLELENAEVVNTDYQNYLATIPDNSLGAVVSNWTLSGSVDPVQTLTAIYDKLTPDGVLAITESPSSRLPEEVYDERGIARLLESRSHGITPKIYFRDLSELLQSIGFSIVSSSRDVPDTSDTVIAVKNSEANEIPVQHAIEGVASQVENARQMVAGLFNN